MRGLEPRFPRLFGGERVIGAGETGVGDRGQRFIATGSKDGHGEATHGTGRTTGRTATSSRHSPSTWKAGSCLNVTPSHDTYFYLAPPAPRTARRHPREIPPTPPPTAPHVRSPPGTPPPPFHTHPAPGTPCIPPPAATPETPRPLPSPADLLHESLLPSFRPCRIPLLKESNVLTPHLRPGLISPAGLLLSRCLPSPPSPTSARSPNARYVSISSSFRSSIRLVTISRHLLLLNAPLTCRSVSLQKLPSLPSIPPAPFSLVSPNTPQLPAAHKPHRHHSQVLCP